MNKIIIYNNKKRYNKQIISNYNFQIKKLCNKNSNCQMQKTIALLWCLIQKYKSNNKIQILKNQLNYLITKTIL